MTVPQSLGTCFVWFVSGAPYQNGILSSGFPDRVLGVTASKIGSKKGSRIQCSVVRRLTVPTVAKILLFQTVTDLKLLKQAVLLFGIDTDFYKRF